MPRPRRPGRACWAQHRGKRLGSGVQRLGEDLEVRPPRADGKAGQAQLRRYLSALARDPAAQPCPGIPMGLRTLCSVRT